MPDWPLSPRGRDRMARILTLPWTRSLRAVWCSTERKARDAAQILATPLGLPITERPALGENDRSSTGYLPRAEFEATADLFFAHPHQSIRGWEPAIDAQHRIVQAVNALLASSPRGDPIAVVAHGGVGTLLLCHLRGAPIARHHDQPPNNGGNYFAFDAETRRLTHGWHPIDADIPRHSHTSGETPPPPS